MLENVDINPQILIGSWKEGWSLDIHTIKSEFLGYDEFGNPHFENIRSDIGDLLYYLKFKGIRKNVEPISKAAVTFLQSRNIVNKLDAIIPVPPSKYRSFQPVIELSKKMADMMSVEFSGDVVTRVKDTGEIKDVADHSERLKILEGAFEVDNSKINNRVILVFDDVYRSGVTLKTITDKLYKENANLVYVLTITKTRTKR